MRKSSICLLALFLCFCFGGCQPSGISGNDFLLQQQSYYQNLQAICSSSDDILTLYLIGSMDITDFQNEFHLLDKQARLSMNQYDQEKAQIIPGSHSYASKAGMEALNQAGNEILNFLHTVLENPSDLEFIAQQYILFQENIVEPLAVYITAKEMIIMESKEGSHE